MTLENIAIVEQRSFGVLTSDSPYLALHTFSLNTCIGLYLQSPNISVLAHLDSLNVTQRNLEHIFQYFQQKWMHFEPQQAVLIASSDTDTDAIDTIKKQLEQKKIKHSVDARIESSVHVAVDRNGYTIIPFNKYTVDQDILGAILASFDRSMKGDKTYQMECVTDKGWCLRIIR